jgi:hypothetical protein
MLVTTRYTEVGREQTTVSRHCAVSVSCDLPTRLRTTVYRVSDYSTYALYFFVLTSDWYIILGSISIPMRTRIVKLPHLPRDTSALTSTFIIVVTRSRKTYRRCPHSHRCALPRVTACGSWYDATKTLPTLPSNAAHGTDAPLRLLRACLPTRELSSNQ